MYGFVRMTSSFEGSAQRIFPVETFRGISDLCACAKVPDRKPNSAKLLASDSSILRDDRPNYSMIDNW